MANWCYNTVTFQGEYLLILQIKELFIAMAEKEKAESKGQLPDGVKANGQYFFDIDWDDTDLLSYQTRNSPNIDCLIEIAKQYHCDFECDYEETGNGVYGKAVYVDAVLYDIFLQEEDFKQYCYDDETETYHFENETYDNDLDILQILLQRKIAIQLP